MKHLYLTCLACCIAVMSFGQTVLYTQNFDDYQSGDPITEVSEAFILWSDNPNEEAYVSSEASFSGANSLKLEATAATGAGPTDVLLYCNLSGIHEFSFKALVPVGNSGYYNFQGMLQVGQGVGLWALDCFMNSDSTVTYTIDPNSPDGVEFTTTYNYGQWVEFTHQIDTDAGTMNILIDGECVGEFPYISNLVGSINFFPTGDDSTPALYYVDDVAISSYEEMPVCDIAAVAQPSIDMEFGPNPMQDLLRVKANFDEAMLRVLALNGQVVFEEMRNDLAAGADIDLNLDNGIYLLELSNGQQRATQRLIVQK